MTGEIRSSKTPLGMPTKASFKAFIFCIVLMLRAYVKCIGSMHLTYSLKSYMLHLHCNKFLTYKFNFKTISIKITETFENKNSDLVGLVAYWISSNFHSSFSPIFSPC